ncbi:hypothetical protein [Hyphomicrobium sp. D-2]|uniref:hypothetical protein n=1 Tax=Hyphomicrobium sp. D-2 TaxID=3041621 RepID=UPI002453A2D4|nr:hypothetical protein [Hyphomicrobium sp. D-2]MDH4983024.1 hypothetical protein [Hyphomicrobium sp. D-2]
MAVIDVAQIKHNAVAVLQLGLELASRFATVALTGNCGGRCAYSARPVIDARAEPTIWLRRANSAPILIARCAEDSTLP